MDKYISLLLFIGLVWGQDEYEGPIWHVSTTGSDVVGDGSEDNPFATIQMAVNNASNSDTVFIRSGLYTENINWSMASNVRLIGTHMDSTIIDGGGLDIVIDNSDETSHPSEISNLTIQNGTTTGKGGGISLKMTGELLLKNIKVDNNYAVEGGGIYIEGEGSISLLSTVVHIENSIISNNTADTNGGGIALSGDLISSIMKNVTVVNNSASNGGGITSGSAGNYVIIANSIFWNNQPTNAGGMIFPYYSNIDIPIGINNTFIDPLFIDDDNDFHLSIGSPCIDSGTELLVVDLSGEMLPGLPPDTVLNLDSMSYFGVKPDMGAYESNYDVQQTCIADDGTEGVELWGLCHSIENTQILNLQNSGLAGFIPPEIGNLINLTYLDLSINQLSGSIPSELWNLVNLTYLNLGVNQLTGTISPEISNMIGLTELYLNDNQFTGHIPESICYLILDDNSTQLAYNQFCPPYPSCILDYVNDQETTNCEEVSVINGAILVKYKLYNAYPNPFNPVTTLKYDLPKNGLVNVTIYDMLGNVVNNLVNDNQSSGYKSVQWDATNKQGEPVSAGVYLYKIQAGDFVDTKKMILLK